jgi:hypothetical protein
MSHHPGAMKDVKDIDPEATNIANHVRSSVEEKAGKTFTVYEPTKYATQVPCPFRVILFNMGVIQ